MGITELLRILKPATKGVSINEFSNQTTAIDMMTWLYKGVYSCAFELGTDEETDKYLNFPLRMLAMLTVNNIKPIAVFDGRKFRPKIKAEELRKENKDRHKELAMNAMTEGNEEEARKYFRQSLKVTSKMINTLIEILHKLKIEVIIAPYEADAQIAYLCNNNLADFAITEDSDLIIFGVERILYKLNHLGEGVLLDIRKFKNMPVEEIADPYCKIASK